MRRPSSPYTLPYWSTTAIGSSAGPILQVQEMCWDVVTSRRIQASSASSDAISSSVGETRSWMMSLKASSLPRSTQITHRLPQPPDVELVGQVVVVQDGLLRRVGGSQPQLAGPNRQVDAGGPCGCPRGTMRLPPMLTRSVAKDCMVIFMSLRRSESSAV